MKFLVKMYFLGSFLVFLATPFIYPHIKGMMSGEVEGEVPSSIQEKILSSIGSSIQSVKEIAGRVCEDCVKPNSEFVYIEGQKFKRNPSGIYFVNGERIFFDDGDGTSDFEESLEPVKKEVAQSPKDLNLNVLSAYNPKNIGEIMQNMKKTKEALEKQQEILNELAEQ